jgi:formylglycine-generating enzyme required for sulfatase activity
MGKRLPTFVEGTKAARGGLCLDGDTICARPNPWPKRKFPWGDDEPTTDRVAWFTRDKPVPPDRSTAAVNSLEAGASPYGALHLAGNVSEWRADGPPTEEHPLEPDLDPIGPMTGRTRQVQNSYWRARFPDALWAGISYPVAAGNQRLYLGFRCAEDGL